MQTHMDDEFNSAQIWLNKLKERADEARAAGKSKITGGEDGEPVLGQWKFKGVSVVHRPPDPDGVLRISIGGGHTPLPCNYLVFRGDHGECVDLLRKALKALEHPAGEG